jgi:AhpC/TSA family
MKRWLLLTALLAAFALPLFSQDDDEQQSDVKKGRLNEAQMKYAALVKEYDTARDNYFKAYQKAKTDEERAKLSYPQPDAYAKRFLDLAKEDPKDPAAVDALVWIGKSCRSGNELDESLDLLLKNCISSPSLGDVALALVYAQTDRTENWLRTVMEQSRNHPAQGNAAYSLGRFCSERAETAHGLKSENKEQEQNLRRWLGDKGFEQLKSKSPDGWQKEAENLFELVIRKYPKVDHYRGTLADAAKGELFEIRNLAIGQVAPEIEGEDVDGKKFKLSDYRGKVVVIDFWGDW